MPDGTVEIILSTSFLQSILTLATKQLQNGKDHRSIKFIGEDDSHRLGRSKQLSH
jgi:hypothetical protein